MMKTISLMMTVLLLIPVAAAQTPPVGILPSSPLWQIDLLFERLQIAITASPEGKAKISLEHAQERQDELLSEVDKKLDLAAAKAQEQLEKDLDEANQNVEKITGLQEKKDVALLVAEMTRKHIEVLRQVLEKVPDNAKEAITRAIERSELKQTTAKNLSARATMDADENKVVLEDTTEKAKLAVTQGKFR